MATPAEISFPPAFISDCFDCGCDVGEIVKETPRAITLRMNADQQAELRSRASHYAFGGLDGAPLWMSRAAKSVLARLPAEQVSA